MIALFIATLAAADAPAVPADFKLDLICEGAVRYELEHSTTTTTRTGIQYDTRTDTYTEPASEGGRVEIHFANGIGKIRYPTPSSLGVRFKDPHVVRELRNVKIDEERISAHFVLAPVIWPKVTVNRRTGWIEVQGDNGFEGQCQAGS
ncbi:hypothetical protein [Caulobacter sp. 17J65-9]|uniref:hypothetical protein n=1 Tax=Caulobacter sp. 17J65-9 TaxID=2709382 RepID=UPI0013CBF4D6|nr:hypothetical protein [Caulobacter sp. 17J65-9]NEX93982.1 hypothetical protein [Caulobacter sp. 17J65-9]